MTVVTCNRIKVSENFYLDEYMDPHTYFTSADHGLSIMDPNIFKIVQKLRDLKGSPLGINNWWGQIENYKTFSFKPLDFLHWCESKKIYVWSGYRSPICVIGVSNGAHQQGRAADPKGDQNLYFKLVKDNAKEFYALGLRRLEDPKITRGWLHLDTWEKNTQPNSVRVVDREKATQIIRW